MRSTKLIIAASGFAVVLFMVLGEQTAMAKQPSFSLLKKDGHIELRQYRPRIVASVEVPQSEKDAANKAFRILAGYIFGKNEAKQKVEMTVPVTEEIGSEKIAMTVPVIEEENSESMRMSFNMPAKYTLASLPKPLDNRIQFTNLPSNRFAVIRFSGFLNERSMRKQTSLLRSYLENNGLKESGKPLKAFYNAPWTLPFLRHNEVLIPIAE